MVRLALPTLLAAAVLGGSGCMALVGNTVDYSPRNRVDCPLPAPPAKKIQIVNANPTEPHAEQGLIDVRTVGSGRDAIREALALLRQEGWRRGCHYVRLTDLSFKPREHYTDYRDPILGLKDLIVTDPHDRRLVSGSCVVLIDRACKPGLASGAPPVPAAKPSTTLPTAAAAPAIPQRGFIDAPPLR